MIRCVFGLILPFLAHTSALDRNCSVPADLFFVIDGSDSLSDEDFSASKNFTVQVLKAFDVQKGAVHVGANVFGSYVYDRIQLLGRAKVMYKLLEKRIETLSRVRSGTATFKAIAEMRSEFGDRGRDGVTKVGIVITDGKSVNLNATAEQALAARAENINIIAIGVGDNIFRPELDNIASSNSSVYETSDVIDLVATIQDAIKDYICVDITTTSTVAPTTPDSSRLDDFECMDCMIDSTHGFMRHPHSCEKYIEIIADENGNRTLLHRKCAGGLFWDQYLSTCRRPEQVQCDIDPCMTYGVTSYDIEELCSGYIMCVHKRSMRACCPTNYAYEGGNGCVVNPACTDTCDGDGDNKLIHPQVCDKIPHPTDNRSYIHIEGEGHANKTMPCAPGTVFNTATCMCDLFDPQPPTQGLNDCSPAANFTFDNDVSDMSGNRAYAGTELVDIISGIAQFHGNGMVNIYRFSMDSFAETLVLRIRFKPSESGQSNEALVTNCVFSTEQSSSVSIRIVRSPTVNVIVFSTDTTLGTQQVPVAFNPNVWNEVTYMYDGSKLYGIVDDGTNLASVKSAPLNGDIMLRRSGLIIGAGSQLNSFTGEVDEFQVYKCLPAFVEQYRA